MKPKKAIKELRKQLKGDPGNVVVKIRLASLLRDVGEYGEAVHIYLSVAQNYQASNRIGQAIAVCKGILEFAPGDQGAHQMLAYLEQFRMQSELEELQSAPLPAPQQAPPSLQSSRRKRPTSFPTPLSDRGRVSPLPGLRTASRKRPSEPVTGTGINRNTRPADGLTLSPKRPEVDFTVVGAPPAPLTSTKEFKLRDLSAAGSAEIREGLLPDDERVTQRNLPKLPGDSRRPEPPPFTSSKRKLPLSAGPGQVPRHRPPDHTPTAPIQRIKPSAVGIGDRTTNTGAHTVPRAPAFRPPDLAPAPTPGPRTTPTPPPLPKASEQSEETYEAGLEDATIVDANFDMAKFILEQVHEKETDDADLPDIPVRRPQTMEEVTRVAELEPAGVDPEKMGALRKLPDYALNALAESATEQDYPSGYMVLSEGDAADTCYLVVSGELQALKRNPMVPNAPLKEAARLTRGSLLGAYALVGKRRFLASVQTSSDSTLIEISRRSIEILVERFPGLKSSLELFYRDRLIETLMSTSRVFEVLDADERPNVVGLFEPVRANPGQAIIREGQRSGGFYLVLTGEVQVSRQEAVRAEKLGAGFYFGEVSLLKGDVAQATVTATTTVELARLDARRFYSLVAANPTLWAHIWKLVNRPELAELQLVAGVAANI